MENNKQQTQQEIDEKKIQEVINKLDFAYGGFIGSEYYTIEWPIVTRRWNFGTCVNEIIQKYQVHSSIYNYHYDPESK